MYSSVTGEGVGDQRLAVLAVIIAIGLFLSGCGHAPRNFFNDNDRLRAENAELRSKADHLAQALALREAEVDQLRHPASLAAVTATQPELAGADPPRFVKLRFDHRFGGAMRVSLAKGDNLVRLYLETLDQQGRFLPVAGVLKAQVVYIQAGKPPLVLGEKSLTARELDDAYRSGITGTHYTVEMMVKPLPPEATSLNVTVSVTDAATGATVSVRDIYSAKPAPTSQASE
ncbi:MAG: hypothetical protein NTW19_21890 [Planctomycetota bacterium]|nr:hypothetical protein [Planctomycetota bacterium]